MSFQALDLNRLMAHRAHLSRLAISSTSRNR
jgi:hypothetical protein